MNEELKKQVDRAKELLGTVKHASMATVNEDGSPHNTPFRFLYDQKLEFVYWGSHPESLHSLNVVRTGKIFVVLYDAVKSSGLYIKAEDGHALRDAELRAALEVHNSFRIKEEKEPLSIDNYMGNNPQRMWRAKITNFWVNSGKRDTNGNIVKDSRQEIEAKDLINS